MTVTRHYNKVFGIGLSKTGTTSLGKALQKLGVPTIDYPHDPRTLAQFEQGDFDLDILRRYDAMTDTPAVPYYPQFDELYPGSKFVLTIRDKQQWLASAEAHWRFREEWARQNDAFRHFSYFILTAVYGCVNYSQSRFSYVYDRHLGEVQHYFRDRADDLLIMDICGGEGWSKLCPFLGLPEPDEPFPLSNTKEEKTIRRRWVERLDAMDEKLRRRLPPGSTIILLDEDQLAGSSIHRRFHCLPLTEREGRYWGPPADSDHAVNELQKGRQAGAGYLVIAWSAFWWLEHYREFDEHLRQYECLDEDENCIIFDLCRAGEGSAEASGH